MSGLEYEFTFEIEQISEALEDSVAYEMGASFFGRSSGTFVTVSRVDRSCFAAAVNLLGQLHGFGVKTLRLVEDLVDRAEIARRTDRTPQSVGLWIRGERRTQATFPPSYTLTSGELWLWRDIQDVLPQLGVNLDEPLGPARCDLPRIGGAVSGMHDGETIGLAIVETTWKVPAQARHSLPAAIKAFSYPAPASAVRVERDSAMAS